MIEIKNSQGTTLATVCADTLRGANLSGANLRGANLSGADLRDVDLRGANLSGADLRDVDLRGANLRDADLRDVDLRGANLRDADLRDVDLRGVNLCDVDLRGVNLCDVDLRGANLSTIHAARLSIVPDTGSFCGWKKCRNDILVRVVIPEDARRSSATGRKCRAEFVDVAEVIGAVEAVSIHDKGTIYRVGERVFCDEWCDDRWIECSGGIHFFITRQEAEDYIP